MAREQEAFIIDVILSFGFYLSHCCSRPSSPPFLVPEMWRFAAIVAVDCCTCKDDYLLLPVDNIFVVEVCQSEGDVDRKADPGVPSKLLAVVLYPLFFGMIVEGNSNCFS